MYIRTNIYLPPQIINFYKRQAKLQGTTMSQAIRTTLQQNTTEKPTDWSTSLISLSKKSKGSGQRHISQNHDQYLLGTK